VVSHGYNISILNIDVEVLVIRELIEFFLEVLGIFHVSVNTEDCPFLEVDGLMHD
jgi:hypothetical protein